MGWELFASKVFARFVSRLIVHCPSAVGIVSSAYCVGAGKISVVPIAEYGSYYPQPPDKKTARTILGIQNADFVYLSFGMIREYKGVDALMRCFTHHRDPRSRLIVLGLPPSSHVRCALFEIARDNPNISFIPEFVDNESLIAYISASDVVVLPYTSVLTSSAPMLASSVGRPMIVSDAGCLQDLPDSFAIHFPAGNDEALQSALETARLAPLDRMGRAAIEFASKLTWSDLAVQTRNVYLKVLN